MAASRKELILAAAWIAAGVTYPVYPNDSEDHQEEMINFGLKYLPLATDMVDAAWNIAMKYPDGYHKSCYDDFGNWLFEHFREEGFDPPNHDDVVQWLVDNTCDEFEEVMTEDQTNNLRRKLLDLANNFTPA